MKKVLRIILIIIAIIIAIVLVKKIIYKVKIHIYLKTYDYLIGTITHPMMFDGEKTLYGYRNGEWVKIGEKFDKDISNRYDVYYIDDQAFYFDEDEVRKLSSELKRGFLPSVQIPEEYQEAYMNHFNNYKYNSKDKEAFDKIVEIANENEYVITYFFVTKNDYFVQIGKNLFKYNQSDNKIEKIFTTEQEIIYLKGN